MSYKVEAPKHFKKSLERCRKRGLDVSKFKKVVEILSECGKLPDHYRPHKLSGSYEGCWECHIQSDWLLIWEQKDDELVLIMVDTGTHSDLY